MNKEQLIDAKWEVIGFTKDSAIILIKEHQKTIILKMDDVNMLIVKMQLQYCDPECDEMLDRMIKESQ